MDTRKFSLEGSLHLFSSEANTFRGERDHLAEHFQFKTGATLYFAQGYAPLSFAA
jgi:hypothetical protein